MPTIIDALKQNPYPGQGILLGNSLNGQYALLAYFILGQSPAEKNLVFGLDGENVPVSPFETQRPPLCYTALYTLGGQTLLANSTQSNAMRRAVLEGKDWLSPIRALSHTTPILHASRSIFARLALNDSGFSYALSLLKPLGETAHQLNLYEFPQPVPGTGHLLCSQSPQPHFSDPVPVQLPNSLREFANTIWNHLDPHHRVSLFTRQIDLVTGAAQTRILNRNY